MSMEEVLHIYLLNKGHRTRCEKEIYNLLGLLRHQYFSTSEECINDRLEKLERHTLRLSHIKDYLVYLKYNRAIDHEEEVQEFLEILPFCITVMPRHRLLLHLLRSLLLLLPRSAPKPSTSELKPEKLTHDSSMANYRTWGKQFRAYFDAGRLDTLPCTHQQAYLNNCIDEVLCAMVNREVSAITPIYSNVPGFLTCSGI